MESKLLLTVRTMVKSLPISLLLSPSRRHLPTASLRAGGNGRRTAWCNLLLHDSIGGAARCSSTSSPSNSRRRRRNGRRTAWRNLHLHNGISGAAGVQPECPTPTTPPRRLRRSSWRAARCLLRPNNYDSPSGTLSSTQRRLPGLPTCDPWLQHMSNVLQHPCHAASWAMGRRGE